MLGGCGSGAEASGLLRRLDEGGKGALTLRGRRGEEGSCAFVSPLLVEGDERPVREGDGTVSEGEEATELGGTSASRACFTAAAVLVSISCCREAKSRTSACPPLLCTVSGVEGVHGRTAHLGEETEEARGAGEGVEMRV